MLNRYKNLFQWLELLSHGFNLVHLVQACHQEAVEILSSQLGDINLEVQYVAAEDSDDENSLGDDMYGFR